MSLAPVLKYLEQFVDLVAFQTLLKEVRAIGGWADFNIAAEPLWKQNCEGSVAFVRCKNAVLYAGTAPDGEPCIRALDIQTGEEIWKHPRVLLSSPVAWGMAVDAKGRIVTALNDGQVMCYGPKPKPVARTP